MLGADQHGVPYRGVTDVLQRTWTQDGPMALWRGFQPRVFWISLGGFVFLGAYEAGKVCILPVLG
jgi:solute carrier family 25 (mitochondrial S-adenosylmethionine transporter), member 26